MNKLYLHVHGGEGQGLCIVSKEEVRTFREGIKETEAQEHLKEEERVSEGNDMNRVVVYEKI